MSFAGRYIHLCREGLHAQVVLGPVEYMRAQGVVSANCIPENINVGRDAPRALLTNCVTETN